MFTLSSLMGARAPSLWTSHAPVRDELFGVERLEQHAASLAAAQIVTLKPPKVLSLRIRLKDNANVLLAAYRASAIELESGHKVVPAAEWLLDNYHLVEAQIREIRDDLPPGYYHQLPKLASGPFAGYPRVFGLAWAYVAHSDSHVDQESLRRFVAAYQHVQPLEIGELWAVAITLRIVLIENLRRLADQMTAGRAVRGQADMLAEQLRDTDRPQRLLDAADAAWPASPLAELFAAQLAKRLRDQDPRTTPALAWLEERLKRQALSLEEAVQHAQLRQGASNVSVRNVITSMRLISDIDWADWFESVSLVDERLRRASPFADMDFATRNRYRSAIEQLARGAPLSELDITDAALATARKSAAQAATAFEADLAASSGDAASRATVTSTRLGLNIDAARLADPGYHLIAEGRPAFERIIGFKQPVRLRLNRLHVRLGMGGYIGAILVVTLGLLALALWALNTADVGVGWLIAYALLVCIPATETATAVINRVVAWHVGASALPGLELASGVPSHLRTLIAVPALLTNDAEVLEHIEQLEVHHLSGAGGDLSFALVLDGVDADRDVLPQDAATLATAAAAIARLNARYASSAGGPRFILLYRRRVFNPAEQTWMGWERKRGKLHELNRLLRGAADTTFIAIDGVAPQVPSGVKYVLTLDADTRLPRDAALHLIGKMAHPLNRPRFSQSEQRVVGGYAILQPRVTPALPIGREGSLYQRVFSSPGGMDPYASAVSDVYQDLFGEGSFTGKGIYDVDAVEAALAGRIPQNTMLSHDLFEGVFARAGLASDIEVVEDVPARYDVAAKRQHRWTRGDWQLLPWITGRRPLTGTGRGKMLDNLRRSLQAPLSFATLALCAFMPLDAGVIGAALIVAGLALPAIMPGAFGLWPRRSGILVQHHLAMLAADMRRAMLQVALALAFMADQAWRMCDAIVRTLVRLVTRRRLLEWTTSAQSGRNPRLRIAGFYREMAPSCVAAVVMALTAVAVVPASWPLPLVLALLWLGAPALAWRVSRSPRVPQRLTLSAEDAQDLRLIARRTWRFFETFVTPLDNMLPPDNFQETPKPVIASRTSPTNIGLYLLSAVSARDFGWAGTHEIVDRIEATFATLHKLPRFNGHFYNWYGTRELDALAPAYVSSVDSGNLAGHLIALANACDEWREQPVSRHVQTGLHDTLMLARLSAGAHIGATPAAQDPLGAVLDELDVALLGTQDLDAMLPVVKRLADKATTLAHVHLPAAEAGPGADTLFWIDALRHAVTDHLHDRAMRADGGHTIGDIHPLDHRLMAVAATARQLAWDMDFAFLLDPERKLLSIGYSVPDNQIDTNCYDLLASEARLASLFAIAKGDVATRHWFRLSRSATPMGNGSALISWSGSMFEYLMPSLVMRAPAGSLLEQTNRLVVDRQAAYGRSLGIPWGVSESAYNARDIDFTYQYANFGVPGLGLKRGLSENVVIAPYATGLATMVDPHAARSNFALMASMGALGHYGFYEALDFTRSRLPEDESVAIVYNYMAHHQGMTIVAIANTLHDGCMRARFHAEPAIQACELLLQERLPRDVAIAHPRAEEVKTAAAGTIGDAPTVRRLTSTPMGAPVTHLLSNGRYAVMLTTAGGGYSRWHDMAVTRWREDTTRDDGGSFVFIRDRQTGLIWSAGVQPVGIESRHSDVVFGEDHAAFTRHDGPLTTSMEVMVSGEDDGEVRRITIVNSGRRARELDITSYAELVLATPAADNAHPAFAKLFVVTEYLPEFGALVATRRPRAHGEVQVWAAHFPVIEAQVAAAPQYESDRAKFVGRGRTVGTAQAIFSQTALSNTVGTVLDPIFSLRQRIRVTPGTVARIAFWTVVASSREALLDLIDRHHDRSAFDRAKTLAWTQAQVQLRHLDIDTEEAADFQRLAAPILYADGRFRAPSDTIARGLRDQKALWPHAISGDLPIVLLRVDDIEDMPMVRQMLRAHEYWRMKRLAVDLVIINERASSYVQDLQIAIDTAVRSNQARPALKGLAQGTVYTLRADLMTVEARALLQAVARIALIARRGSIATQLARMPALALPMPKPVAYTPTPVAPTATGTVRIDTDALEFFNGLGGFAKDGREYVVVLEKDTVTPAPWINVIANPTFGCQVSAEGNGYTWAGSSRENQLTQWSNDPVVDPPSEAIYVRDEVTGDVCSASAQPIRDDGTYVTRHGFGYSRFEHMAHGIALDLLQFVPLEDPVKISRMVLRNLSGRTRRVSVTAYAEWVLGTLRGASAPFIVTEIDEGCGALFARNPYSMVFTDRVAFMDMAGLQTSYTGDRTAFIGRNGSLARPAALYSPPPLPGTTGAGIDPCGALQRVFELAPGESIETTYLMGQCASTEEARALVLKMRGADLDAALERVTAHWDGVLGTVQVKTPDRAMDIMLNGWLLYQTLACRVWARSAFYQASGAYGFRDQLQDGMALTLAMPQETRSHLLRAAGRQFPEGDVQHWWLPHSGQGVRTHISDDRVWLAYAVATYVARTGDAAVLAQPVPFIEGARLAPEEHDAFFQPMTGDESASLLEHCARGLDQCLTRVGQHGLPLMGTGDWNDGMNKVGEHGRGESVWLGWLQIRAIAIFAPLAEAQAPARAAAWRAHAAAVRQAIEHSAWDGAWYRRATFDDGTWLGGKDSEACRIDAIAQSWAVLSQAADPARARMAMTSVEQHLISDDHDLSLLFAPPFDHPSRDPGYIAGYPPGLRENGGQYSHAAMWNILAFAALDDGDRAHRLFARLNPINHARHPDAVARYKVEPYVVAADVYAVAPHTGRGGWTWYTGSAGWMHQAGVEGILGIRQVDGGLSIDPRLPADWPGFEATITIGDTHYAISVTVAPSPTMPTIEAGAPVARLPIHYQAQLDGVEMMRDESGASTGAPVRVPLQGGHHRLTIRQTRQASSAEVRLPSTVSSQAD
ncbi:GH36-type glycosyl hydrolase domain-containing protein [Schauerella aestuarii]|uniref:GH36-type glycosyl hydrolase domain-containing protein n=1 Tax=Schauerella aestuarii TaxID=2511204 RepID=UPI0013683121|nr:glucoamylase family protein [Achromobacter aestuarii]MYZ44947.1 glycosyl transferase [Achromobacter aestuarii]